MSNEPLFNGVYSRDNLPKIIPDGEYVISLDEYADVGTHWFALYLKKYWNYVFWQFLGLNMFLKTLKNLLGIKT